MSNVVIIPFNAKSNLYLRKDKIVATVATPGSDKIEIYTEGCINPFHIDTLPADAALGLIWGGEGDDDE